MVASFQPLNVEELFSLVSSSDFQFSDKYEFKEMLQNMLPHILQISENGDITLFHSLLADWLTDPGRRGHPCFINEQNEHKTITHAVMKKIIISGDDVDHDSVNWLINHLNFANITVLFEKLKDLPARIVDKTEDCDSLNRTCCLSSLDRAAQNCNSYKLLKTILSLSETINTTSAAVFSITNNNTDSLRAILEYGHVDVSAIGEMFDLAEPVYERDQNRYKEKDAFTILHFAISHKNCKAFKLIVEYNSSALHFNTRSGASVLQVAVLSGDFQILKLCLEYVPIEKDILPFAAYFADDRSVELLQKHGAKDVCLKCEKNIFIRENRGIYFAKYNKIISIDEKRWLKDSGEINHFVDSAIFKFTRAITCECVLHIAVRHGNAQLVYSILRQSASTIECVDFQGLTPLASAVIFQHHDIVKYLLYRGANVNFVCDPTDVMSRVNMLRYLKVYSLLYDDLYFDEYCPKGARIGHLISLNPTCEITKVILGYVNIRDVFYRKDKKGRNPLFYFLCQKQMWGRVYFNSKEFVSGKHIQMLMFLIASQHGISDSSRLLTETGICGNKLRITNVNLLQTICLYSPDKFPDIDELFIQVGSIIHKTEEIATMFPIKKEVILKIMYNKRVEETETIISCMASPPKKYFKNVKPSSMQFENEIEIKYMSLLLDKLKQTGDEFNSWKTKHSGGHSSYKIFTKRQDLRLDIIDLSQKVIVITNKWQMLLKIGIKDNKAIKMQNLMKKGLKIIHNIPPPGN